MESTELRIGNLLENDGGRVRIESIQKNGGVKIYDFYNKMVHRHLFDLDHFRGIPLTEEWLIKLGFCLVESNPFPHLISLKYWVYDGVCLFFNEPKQEPLSWFLGIADQRMGFYHVVTIRWIDKVHEIQNAYFGIKGKELTIYEPTKQSEE